MLADKMRRHDAKAWLVNTGLTGGPYGEGSRIDLKNTRAIIDAIHKGELTDVATAKDEVFGFDIPKECPNVPSKILQPRETWGNPENYNKQAAKLGKLFQENFKKYEQESSQEIINAGPKV